MSDPVTGSSGTANVGGPSGSISPDVPAIDSSSVEINETITTVAADGPREVIQQASTSSTAVTGPSNNMNRRELSAQEPELFRAEQTREVTGLRGIRTFIQQWARNSGLALMPSRNNTEYDVERLGNRPGTDNQVPPHSGSNSALDRATGSVSNVGMSTRGRAGSSPPHPRRGSAEFADGNSHATVGGSRSDTFVLDMDGISSWGDGNADNATAANDGAGTSRNASEEETVPSASARSPQFENEDSGVVANPDDPEANATGERSPADLIRDSPETRAFINEINKYTTVRPFLLIMLLKGLLDHGSGIICSLALAVTFSHSDSLLKKEVSKQKKRNLMILALICSNVIGCSAFIYYVFSDEELYYALGFMKTKVELKSFWGLMWVLVVSDYIAKFGAVMFKVFIVGLPAGVLPYQKRGKYYLFIEQTFQLYRSFIPVHHWLLYLINSYTGATKTFGLLLAGIYAIFKMTDSIQRIKDWKGAFTKLLQTVHYGTTPTVKELDSVGPTCPICHDSFTTPTRLSCTHIFCEECVSTWFDRERTCPMCRAKVVDDPTYRDGSTSQYVQLF